MHWDPEFSDVKIVQAFLLTTELDRIIKQSTPGASSKDIPIIMCGDYNSLPGSGVAEYIRTGRVGLSHVDFQKLQYNKKLVKMNPKNGEVNIHCTNGAAVAEISVTMTWFAFVRTTFVLIIYVKFKRKF